MFVLFRVLKKEGDLPIHGTIRYLCANCDYDLCEICEASNFQKEIHDTSHIFLRIQYPLPPQDVRASLRLTILYHNKPKKDNRMSIVVEPLIKSTEQIKPKGNYTYIADILCETDEVCRC